MRTTVRIENDLLLDLKDRAQQEQVSLTKMLNRALRQGMRVLGKQPRRARPFREKTYAMGEPTVNLDRALMLAAAMEDEEVCQKLARRK